VNTPQDQTPTIPQRIARIVASPPITWLYLNVFPAIDRVLLRLSRGRFSVTIGQPMTLLTTIGAKSGQPRTTPLLCVIDGDRVMLIASNGGQPRHPAWYYNLRAHPEATLLLHGRSTTYTAREVYGEERAALWQRAVRFYPGYAIYQQRAGQRKIPVLLLTPKAT
jgi:deazaflavin-dependent oxidoreductase (nitroreductase family)